MQPQTRNPLIVSGAPILGSVGGSALCRILGLSAGQLVKSFDLATLDETGPGTAAQERRRVPPIYQMRARAWALVCSHRWRGCSRVILFGRQISRAFGLRSGDAYLRWIEWGYWEGRAVGVVPHTVGAAAWWADPDNRRRGARFMREAAELPLGDLQGALEIGVVED